MAIPVMSPRLEILTNLRSDCSRIGLFGEEEAVKMSNGKMYTYPLFVESSPYSKFVVLFEDEGERRGEIITAIRID